MLKRYKKKLSEELKQVSKTQVKLAKRVTDQIHEFEFLENQLISWGLPKYIPTFKMQVKPFVFSNKCIAYIFMYFLCRLGLDFLDQCYWMRSSPR
jgi:hypothetical protein